MNAFKQLHLNIKSNLPSPFGSGAFAEPDELYLCAGVEGKGAGEPSGLAWEHAGMVHETHQRVACSCSENGGRRRGRLSSRHWQLAPQGVERPVHAGVQ